MTATRDSVIALATATLAEAQALPLPPAAPTIQGLTVTPNPVPAGAPVTISATVTDATDLKFGGLTVTLPYTFTPPSNATSWAAALVATGPGGILSLPIVITILPAAGGDPLKVMLQSQQYHDQGPQSRKFDLVRASKCGPRVLPPTYPVENRAINLFRSPLTAPPTSELVVPLYGPISGLYEQQQYIRPSNSTVAPNLSDPLNTEWGSYFGDIVQFMNDRPMTFGERGKCWCSPYGIYVSHPVVFPAGMPNAGQPIDPGRAPFGIMGFHNAQFAGLFQDRMDDYGKVTGVTYMHDWCVDESDRQFGYIADLGVRIGQNFSGSRIARFDRAAGKQVAGGPIEDATKWVLTTEITGTMFTSVKTDKAGNVYAVDAGAGKIWKKTKTTGLWAVLTSDPYAFYIDLIDDLDMRFLVVATRDVDMFTVNMDTGAQSIRHMPAANKPFIGAFAIGNNFITASVDWGACGTRGMVRLGLSVGGANTSVWDLHPDWSTSQTDDYQTTVPQGQQLVTPSQQGWNSIGLIKYIREWQGHYPWGEVLDRYQGIWVSFGFASNGINITILNPVGLVAQGPDVQYSYIHSGRAALSQAGLTTVVSTNGHSIFKDCSWEEIAERNLPTGEPDFDGMLAFYVQGLITETPRPELNGPSGWKLVLATVQNSSRRLREGAVIMNKAIAWATAKGLNVSGTADPVTPYNPEATTYLEVRGTPSNLRIVGCNLGPSSSPMRYAYANAAVINGYTLPVGARIVAWEGIPGMETQALSTIPTGVEVPLTVVSPGMSSRAIVMQF